MTDSSLPASPSAPVAAPEHKRDPWLIIDDAANSNNCRITSKRARHIAKVYGYDPEESRARARLISAAPDLFEALSNLTANVETAWPALSHLGPLVAARAALAKATGND